MSTGKQLLEELRKDEDLRRALAEELLPETLRHRELRRTILLALSKEMATKEDIDNLREDIENLRRTTKEDIEKFKVELKSYMDARIDDMNIRIGDLYGVIKASLVAIVVTLASTILVPLILKIFF